MLDAAGVQQQGVLGLGPQLRRADNRCRRHAGDLGCPLWRITSHGFAHRRKSNRVRGYEVVVDPIPGAEHVQDAVHQRAITSRAHRQKQVGGTGDRGHTWVDHD